MRFHTRRLLFTTRRVERSSFTAATCCSLSFISPYSLSLTFTHSPFALPFLSLSLSPSLTPLRARASRAGGRIQAESTLYILGGSAYFVYPLFIVGSLPLFFCYVLPAPELLAAHRLPSPFLLFFFSSLSLSPLSFLSSVAEAYIMHVPMYTYARR